MEHFDHSERSSAQWQKWETKANFKYAIVHDGRIYPVKEIVSQATGTPTSNFSGGTQANNIIRRAGFSIEALHLPSEGDIQAALHDLFLTTASGITEISEAYQALADQFGLPDRLRTKRMENSDEVQWQNRVRVAHRKLMDMGIIDRSEHGRWTLAVRTQPKVWIEKSLIKGRPDRTEGEHALGVALWSPTRAHNDADIYRNMRLVQPGDVVLHLTDNSAFTGMSTAASRADPNFKGLQGTIWAGLQCYRISLQGFSALQPPLARESLFGSPQLREKLVEIRQKNSNLFYDPDLKLHQGGYLTEAPAELFMLLDQAYQEAGHPLPIIPKSESGQVQEPPRAPLYSIEQFSAETAIPAETIQQWENRLKRKQHVIFQGPPGTGKTYIAERLSRLLISGTFGFVETVQFHPSYGYEDFMIGIRPAVLDRQLTFKLEHGLFLQFCERARQLSDGPPCVLIIDEINRGDLSRIFGELMYLLEYRDKAIALAGESHPFGIPPNVFLIGTMNTADRSIALVDHALRRRFSFIHLGPDYTVLHTQLQKSGLPADAVVEALRAVNIAIEDRNYEVGISFFLKDGERLRHTLKDVWEGEIEPYLEEYFYDQPGKVEPFRWKRLVTDRFAAWNTEV
jgi:hypothetical protein